MRNYLTVLLCLTFSTILGCQKEYKSAEVQLPPKAAEPTPPVAGEPRVKKPRAHTPPTQEPKTPPGPKPCEPGSQDCACDVGSKCYSTPTQALVCKEGICVADTCPAGTKDCKCFNNGTCNPKLACKKGVCIDPDAPPDPPEPLCKNPPCVGSAGVSGVPPKARACELLLDVGSQRVAEVKFDSAVVGQHVWRRPRLALAFTVTKDAAVPAAPFTIHLEDVTGPEPKVTLLKATCYDGLGHALAEANIGIQVDAGTGEKP